jgi:hypothetical protein
MVILILLWLVVWLNQGHLIYALDDAYIHLAIAKNLSQHGVWGVSQYGFSSASSSLLWTVLLTGCNIVFSVSNLTPFILNIIFSLSLVILVYAFLKQYIKNNFFIFGTLLLVVFAAPLPSLIFSGMEHILHIILSLAFLCLAVNFLTSESNNKYRYCLLAMAPFLAAVRYEGLILIGIIAILLLFKRQYSFALSMMALAFLPLVVFGLVSLSHGWYFLPNSILLKSNAIVWSPYFSNYHNIFLFFQALLFGDNEWKLHLFGLMLLSLIIILSQSVLPKNKLTKTAILYNLVFLLTAILHLIFGRLGWFYRYEAYLLVVGLAVASISVVPMIKYLYCESSKTKLILSGIVYFLLTAVFITSIWRGLISFISAPIGTTNIYQQQYQMGLFVKKFYSGHAIALNDIGAVDYLSEPRVFDIWGLANMDTAKLRLRGHYTAAKIDVLTKNNDIEIAIVYDAWLRNKNTDVMPLSWTKVGQWKILHNITCGDDTVSFYAVAPTAKDDLINSLRIFSRDLPSAVQQSGVYLQY